MIIFLKIIQIVLQVIVTKEEGVCLLLIKVIFHIKIHLMIWVMMILIEQHHIAIIEVILKILEMII